MKGASVRDDWQYLQALLRSNMRRHFPLPEGSPPDYEAMKKRMATISDSALPALLLDAARTAYRAHYDDKWTAEALALYQAGHWFSVWTGTQAASAIAEAFGVDLAFYGSAVQRGKIIAVTGDIAPFERAYSDFLEAMKAAFV